MQGDRWTNACNLAECCHLAEDCWFVHELSDNINCTVHDLPCSVTSHTVLNPQY